MASRQQHSAPEVARVGINERTRETEKQGSRSPGRSSPRKSREQGRTRVALVDEQQVISFRDINSRRPELRVSRRAKSPRTTRHRRRRSTFPLLFAQRFFATGRNPSSRLPSSSPSLLSISRPSGPIRRCAASPPCRSSFSLGLESRET